MIKKSLVAIAIVAVLFLFFKVDSSVRGWIVSFTNNFKSTIRNSFYSLQNRFDSFMDQSDKIIRLEEKLRQMKKYQFLTKDLSFRLKKMQELCEAPFDPQTYSMILTRMIAYSTLGDFTSAWLKADEKGDFVYGLVGAYGVAGIAVRKQGGVLALFNGNKKCSYTVSIADGIKGIATGSGDNRYILVKYIQSYEDVKPGQKVYTNSYDNIFPYGLPVGVVEKVWQEGSYKVAKVKTAEDLQEPLYFWLVRPLSNEDIK